MTCRLTATGRGPMMSVRRKRRTRGTRRPADRLAAARTSELGGFVETPAYDRERLAAARDRGPAVVEEEDSTAVIGPGATAT